MRDTLSSPCLLLTGHHRCAAINGVNPAVISRANELATLSARGDNLIAACATMSLEETQVLEEAVRNPKHGTSYLFADH